MAGATSATLSIVVQAVAEIRRRSGHREVRKCRHETLNDLADGVPSLRARAPSLIVSEPAVEKNAATRSASLLHHPAV